MEESLSTSKFTVLTLFPEMFTSFLSGSIIGRAVAAGKIAVDLVQIRDFSASKHKKVDDTPCGGGAGMVMAVQPLRDALHSVRAKSEKSRVILMSPRGRTLDHKKCLELAAVDHIVLICGHYEGIDQRFIDRYVEEEISIGDYVLTGGELASMVLMDAVSRLRDSVLGNCQSFEEESFTDGLLEYPHYTRPIDFEGMRVPEILLSGHHKKIREWRLLESLRITKEKRPDLYENYLRREHPKEIKKIIDFFESL